MGDAWQTPAQTLATSHGDCEDYAILKYATLLRSGLSVALSAHCRWRDQIDRRQSAACWPRVSGWRVAGTLDNNAQRGDPTSPDRSNVAYFRIA